MLLFVWIFFAKASFLRRIMAKHNQVWVRLGKPTQFINNSIKNNILMFKFLNRKEFLRLDDLELTKKGKLIVLLMHLYLPIIIISMISAVVLVQRVK